MHAGIRPPDACAIGILARIAVYAPLARQVPLTAVAVESDRGHHLPLAGLVELPAAHVVTTANDAGSNPFRHPGFEHEIADLGSTRTRSPVPTPRRLASPGCSQSGLVWAISSSHLAFALRV